MVERCGLGVLLAVHRAGVGVLEHVQALGVGRHDPVLDAVVNHLDEVAGAVGSAVQIALLVHGRLALAAWRALRGVDPGGDGREDRLQVGEHLVLGADHQAEAALEAEDAAARADVD